MSSEQQMPAAEQSALCLSLAEALGVGDGSRCLSDVLAVLERHDIVQCEPTDAAASWLCIERPGRVLHFAPRGRRPDPATRELLGHLIRTACLRTHEREERERIRERMDMLSSASFEGVMIHVDGRVIDANQRFSEMFGYEPGELFGDTAFERWVAPEDHAMARERIARRMEGAYLITGLRKDGSRFIAEVLSKQGRLGENPVRVVALRDVTERERTQALLRESEVRLRHLVEASFDLVVLSRGGRIIEVGGAFEAVLGFKREQLVGRRLLDFIAAQTLEHSRAIIDAGRLGMFRSVVVGAAGEQIPVEVVAVTSTLEGEPVRLTGVRDLREAQRLEQERRKLELQAQRGQRLESLGTLAGGIAHDFNNLLVGVLGNAELLSTRLSDPEDMACCDTIRMAAERAASLTKQLLAYAGKSQPGARGPIDIALLARENRALLDATLAKRAHLELRLEPDCVVVGERATITQVLVHLVTNASDALADKPGVITLSARRIHAPGPEWQHALGAATAPGDWVLLQVKDTGIGMDEATVGRVFEPFFSTKAKGHGLGLAACLGIVAAHGGAIRVESTLGAGSCVSVLLPALSDATRTARDAPRKCEPASCKLLVIDDEPLVLSNVRRSLEQRGFQVFEACDGPTALACYRDVAADVILIDLTMPGIDGIEVVRRMRAAGLLTPIILSSGNLDDEVLRRLPQGAIQGTLPKPYGPKALLEAIDRALDAVDAGRASR
jgi:two-component system, cell cycle sensor histidine kinase and response regulator CckA